MQGLLIKILVKNLFPAMLGGLAVYLSTYWPEAYGALCGAK